MGEPELGNVSINELEEVQHATLHIPLVERAVHFAPSYPMSVYNKAARTDQQITIDCDLLAVAQLSLIHS